MNGMNGSSFAKPRGRHSCERGFHAAATHLADVLHGAPDQQLQQPAVVAREALQEPAAGLGAELVQRHEQVRPVLEEHFLLGVDQRLQQERRAEADVGQQDAAAVEQLGRDVAAQLPHEVEVGRVVDVLVVHELHVVVPDPVRVLRVDVDHRGLGHVLLIGDFPLVKQHVRAVRFLEGEVQELFRDRVVRFGLENGKGEDDEPAGRKIVEYWSQMPIRECNAVVSQ